MILNPFTLGRALDVSEMVQQFGFVDGEAKTATISAGILTLAGTDWYRIEPEGLAASDELTRINGVPIGQCVWIYITSASRKVFAVPGTYLKLQGQFLWDSPYDCLALRSFGGDVLVELPGGRISIAE